jgi:ferrous iron transport protein B
MKSLHIALAGNPNAGKTTVFNALTGENQHTGNWPGKTVERKAGFFNLNGLKVEIVDLPGTYSLSSYSPEEEIARDYIVLNKPDIVVNVVDASNLERNLYLTVQILETGAPLILLLNMRDLAERHGCNINADKLSKLLDGIPVIQTVANKGGGLEKLKDVLIEFQTGRDQAL